MGSEAFRLQVVVWRPRRTASKWRGPRRYQGRFGCACGCGLPVQRDGSVRRPCRPRLVRELEEAWVAPSWASRLGVPYVCEVGSRCWVWDMKTDRKGYGVFRAGGRELKAHRWFFQAAGGVIPEGWQVHHECGNSRCVNPEHLRALSPVEHGRLHAGVQAEVFRLRRELEELRRA